MKIKSQRTAPSVENVAQVNSHLQNLTEDLTNALTGGLTIADNLPFKLYQAEFTSGRPKEVSASYAAVMFCDAGITKIAYRTVKAGLLSVTLTMDKSKANVVLLLTNEVAQ